VTASPAYRRFLERLEATRTLGVSLGLDRMQEALRRLGCPQKRVPALHVAGTNGKGSTVAMADAVLRRAGRRTGLFTSPHLARFTERIRIAGQEIGGDEVAALGERVFATGVPLTYFEVATALGFVAMAEAAVDIGIFEVGLGGRLDATNLCRPIATAITSIGLDHTELLGSTLAAIAHEKAGIAKPGVPMWVGAVPAEAMDEIARSAAAVGAPLYRVEPEGALATGLPGAHQAGNAALARALAIAVARTQGFALSPVVIAEGLAGVEWPGRLEEVVPGVWLDAAHNAEGARALAAALPGRAPRALVVSVVRGKAAAEMLATLAPGFASIFVTRSSSSRATPLAELAALVPTGLRVDVVDDPREALARARAAVAPHGTVVVAGSIFLVGELRAALTGEPVDPVVTGDPMP
jgi:dihydrofolate synthase / folylpolyglutamate synthase